MKILKKMPPGELAKWTCHSQWCREIADAFLFDKNDPTGILNTTAYENVNRTLYEYSQGS